MACGATTIKNQGATRKTVGSFMENYSHSSKLMTTKEHEVNSEEDKHMLLILKKLTKRMQRTILKLEGSIRGN